MARFAQHSRLRARPGKRYELIAKFLEIPVMQADNPACELTIVSSSPEEDDIVYLTEVWTSTEEHEKARQSSEVEAWAADMPSLVAGLPESTPLVIDSAMYFSAQNGFYALDAVTGKQIWKFDATQTTRRGVSYQNATGGAAEMTVSGIPCEH